MRWFPSGWIQREIIERDISYPLEQDTPLVSIIIPVYNGASFLSQAIESAINQTYPNREILVVNDGSNDNGATESIASRYSDKIRYYYKPNGGVASALNFGLDRMNGTYFSWLSHDDLYHPDKVERQVREAQKYTQPVIIYSDYDVIDEDSRILYRYHIAPIRSQLILADLIIRYPIFGCATLIPKIAFDTIGRFDEGRKTTQDYDLYFRLTEKFEFIYMTSCAALRVHPNQESTTAYPLHKRERDELLQEFLLALPGRLAASGNAHTLKYILFCSSIALLIKDAPQSFALSEKMFCEAMRANYIGRYLITPIVITINVFLKYLLAIVRISHIKRIVNLCLLQFRRVGPIRP